MKKNCECCGLGEIVTEPLYVKYITASQHLLCPCLELVNFHSTGCSKKRKEKQIDKIKPRGIPKQILLTELLDGPVKHFLTVVISQCLYLLVNA